MPLFRLPRAARPTSAIQRAIIISLTIVLLALLYIPRLFAVTPAVPYIDIVAPVSITPGSTGVTLTLLGAGFSATTVVRWNGVALSTTFVSTKKMTSAVPDTFVAAVGLGTITAQTGSGVSYHQHFIPFVQVLAGGARLNASSGGLHAAENGLLIMPGVGIDLALHHHFAIRALQVDYMATRFGVANGSHSTQNNLRISAGIVFRFGDL